MRHSMLKQLKKGMSVMVMASLLLGAQQIPASAASAKVQKVAISKPDTKVLVLKKNSKYQLKVKVTVKGKASKKVTYKSSKPSIVKVSSSGKLTAVKNGTAKITVKSAADSSKKATLTVKTGTPVTSVKLNKTKLSGIEGGTATLKATVSPKNATQKTVAYTSSNSNVAKVSNSGKVTFVKAGTAKITAKAQDGSAKKAICKITVKEKNNNNDKTPVETIQTGVKYGRLQLCKVDHDGDASTPERTQLCDSNGNPVQLKGMSTHGLQWDVGEWILNEKAFDALAYDWKCDIIRLAMYVGEDGYAAKPQELLDKIEKGIRLATERKMYVLVDWHVHDPGNPNDEVYMKAGLELAKKGGPLYEIAKKHPEYNGAQLFFAYMSEKYGAQDNVLFELANEPNNLGSTQENAAEAWSSQLKPYFEKVISAIREYDADKKDNIIICGTDNWSQFVNAPVNDPLKDSSTMYTVHFYSGTHDAGYDEEESYWLRDMIDNALNNGLAVFCTEWGTSQANGDTGPYIDFAERWLDYLSKNGISWCNWSLTNKAEKSAAFATDVLKEPEDINGDGIPEWDKDSITVSGNYVRAKIRGEETPTYGGSEIVVDFEDGTGQCSVDSDSTNQEIVLEPEVISTSTVLKIGNVSGGSIWDNRIRLSNLGTTYGKYQNLTFDLIIKNENVSGASITIQPIFTCEAANWWNQDIEQQVFAADNFELLNDEYSVCHVSFSLAALKASPEDAFGDGGLMLLLEAGDCDTLYIDNIGVYTPLNNGDIQYDGKLPDNPGEFVAFPYTFESGTREGWVTDGASKLDYLDFATGLAETTALKFPVAFAGTHNEWEDGARIKSCETFPEGLMTLERSRKVKSTEIDVYLEPGKATEGMVQVRALPIPDGGGYWYDGVVRSIDPVNGGETITNDEGTTLLKYHLSIPFSEDGKYPYDGDYPIRNLTIVVYNDDSNYVGNVYLDNIAFAEEE